MSATAVLCSMGGLVLLVGAVVISHAIDEDRRQRRLNKRHRGTFRDFIRRNDR